MRPVRIPESLVGEIRRHAREAYPDECCGILFARADPSEPDAPRTVVALERAANEFEGERRRRFVIRPDDLRSAERSVEGTDRNVAGFYHSHPDHPARPSAFDQDHAWPWYTYVVVGVTATDTPAIGAFELGESDGTFREVPLAIVTEPDEAPEKVSALGVR